MESFSTASSTAFVAVVLIGLPVGAFVIFKIRQNAVHGAWLVIASACFNAILLGQTPLIHAGISVYFVDLAYGALAFAALTRIGPNLSIAPIPTTWIVFAAVMVLSCLVGLSSFGTSAGVEFREHFCLLSASAYFAVTATSRDVSESIPRVLIVGGVLISLVVLLRWTLPETQMSLHADLEGLDGRAIPASSAFVVLVGAVVLIHFALIRGLSAWQATILFLLALVVVGIRHRTVWFAAIGGLLFLILFQKKGRGSLIAYGAVMASVGLIVSLLMFQAGIGTLERIAERLDDFGSASSGTGTFLDRYLGWLDLLGQYAEWSYLDQFFGRAFGSGFGRVVTVDGATHVAQTSPHNYYVDILFRVGLIGLVMFLVTIFAQLVRLVRFRSPATDNSATLYSMLLVMGSIYAITYRVPELFGAILGCSFAALRAIPYNTASLRRSRNDCRRPPHLPQPPSEDSRVPGVAAR